MLLRIADLTKRYPTGDEALRGVSLAVPAGCVVAVIGPSGAGKSTLIRCVNRLVEPTSGQIALGDTDVLGARGAALRATRRQMGMIFQEFALVDRLTVIDNVLSGCLGGMSVWDGLLGRFRAADRTYARELLARVGIADLATKRADALSGGQRQRVGIARALAQRPSLLLVDEPTASLDPATAKTVMALMAEVCRERELAALVNLHDVELARAYADRVIALRHGRLVFDGPPAELDNAALTAIYGPAS
ncbi:MAG: phosphonate ABC transporter ATP-binding protein [Myxococcota bacterium]